MSLNVIDVVILLFLAMGAVLGFKKRSNSNTRNFNRYNINNSTCILFKKSIISFNVYLFTFFKLGGIFKGITVVNILIYEAIAFS